MKIFSIQFLSSLDLTFNMRLRTWGKRPLKNHENVIRKIIIKIVASSLIISVTLLSIMIAILLFSTLWKIYVYAKLQRFKDFLLNFLLNFSFFCLKLRKLSRSSFFIVVRDFKKNYFYQSFPMDSLEVLQIFWIFPHELFKNIWERRNGQFSLT